MEPELAPLIDLALTQGADYVEVRYQSDSYESNLLRNGISEVSSFETRRGVSVRVLADGGLGFGATGSLTKSDLRKMVQRTVRSAKASARVRKGPIAMGEAEMAKGSVEKRPRVRFEDVGIVSHESAGHPGEADRMLGREAAQAGETYLREENLGRQIGSEVLNVVDDPTLYRSFGFYNQYRRKTHLLKGSNYM